jgi:hypothetical protein
VERQSVVVIAKGEVKLSLSHIGIAAIIVRYRQALRQFGNRLNQRGTALDLGIRRDRSRAVTRFNIEEAQALSAGRGRKHNCKCERGVNPQATSHIGNPWSQVWNIQVQINCQNSV